MDTKFIERHLFLLNSGGGDVRIVVDANGTLFDPSWTVSNGEQISASFEDGSVLSSTTGISKTL